MANTGSRVMDASNQLSSSNRDRMSALDMALFGKALASEEDVIGSSVDFEDEDWKMAEETAKSGGVGSWFASRVDFRVNGTRIRGKKGYSVGGGVVPLFDGAAIDLKKAKMRAPKKNQAESDPIGGSPDEYQNWVVGTGGQLVLAPSGVQNVVPFRMDQIVVTEQGVMGKADKSFRFVRGDEEVTGDGLVLKGSYAILYGVNAKKEREDEPVHNRASITGAGLQLYYLPKPRADEQEQVAAPEEAAPPGHAADVEHIHPDAEKGTGIIPVLQAVGEMIGPVGGEGISADLTEGDAHVKVEKSASNSEADTLLEKMKDSALEKLKDLGKDILSGKKSVGDVGGQILEEARALWNQLKGDDLKNAWASIPEVCRSYLYREMSEDEVKGFMERLAPGESLMKLLGMDGDDKQELDGKSGKDSITMARIPLFPPFLDFTVTFSPEYSFGAYLKGDAHGLYNIWKKGEGETTDISLDAGLRGHLSLEASAMLAAGVSYLINVSAGLFAKAGLTGSVDDAKTFLKGKAGLSFKKAENGEIVLADDIKTEIDGGLKLEGSFGAKGTVESQILFWSKDLFTYDFYKWNLAEFSMRLAFSKSKEERDLFSGWNMDEANFSVDGIMGKFLEKNNESTKYGFNPSEMEEKAAAGYEDAEKAFEEALFWLEEFHQKERVVGVTIASDGSSLNKVSDIGIQVQDKFLKAWASAKINLETQTKRLEGLEGHTSARKKAEESVQKHQSRLEQMKDYYDAYWDSDGNIKQEAPQTLLEHYRGLDGKPGMGFTKAMQKKAEETIYTYDHIVAYEERRRSEVIEQRYSRKSVSQHKAFFANADMLEAYEQGRLGEVTSKHKKGIDELAKSLEDLKKQRELLADPDELNKKFMAKYAGSISDSEILQYGHPRLLLRYVEGVIQKQANQQHAMDALMTTRANKEALKDHKEEAIRQYFSVKKGSSSQSSAPPPLITIWGEDSYRAASADDLIQLEQEQMMQHGGSELQDFLQPDKETTEIIGGKEVYEQFIARYPVLKGEKAGLEKRYKAWIAEKAGKDNTGLTPYLTLELLLQYEEQRLKTQMQEPKKTSRIQTSIAEHTRRKSWLDVRLMDVNHTDPEMARELESKYIQEYLKEFNPKQVFKDLKSMKFVDLRLLMLSQTESHQQRIESIERAKQEGKSAREIWEIYEKEGGSRKEVTKMQKEKLRGNEAVTLDDIERFEAFAVSEMVDRDDWDKFERLSQMMGQKNYQAMLDIYATMGMGIKSGYVEKLKMELKEGRLEKEDGSVYMPEDILSQKIGFAERFGKKHQDRLDLIRANKDKPYLELLALYNGHTQQDGEGIRGTIRSLFSLSGVITLSNGFEKSLKDMTLSPEQIDEFEEMMKGEIGKKHSERIRKLTEGGTPTEEEKKARAQDYIGHAKGFKKDQEIKKMVAEERKRLLFEEEPKKMYENIKYYEESRKKSYEMTLDHLDQPIKKTRLSMEQLTANINVCESVMDSFAAIKADPKSLWEKEQYDEFKEMTRKIIARKNEEEGIKTLEKDIAEMEQDITMQEEAYKTLEDMLQDDDTSGPAQEI